MRIPRRETQIFSLSMMDVISGAMGAFLIIMIVLARSYKDDADVTEQREELQRQLDEIQERIEDAMKTLQNTTDLNVEELLEEMAHLREQMRRMKRDVNRQADDMQAARNRANQLQQELEELKRQLEEMREEKDLAEYRRDMREPFMVVARWAAAEQVDVDVFLEPSLRTKAGKEIHFNPKKKSNWCWSGDIRWDGFGTSGPDVWVNCDSQKGATYRVYIVMTDEKCPIRDASVRVHASGQGMWHEFEPVTLGPSKRWELVGILTTEGISKTTARNATEEERRMDRPTVDARPLPTEGE